MKELTNEQWSRLWAAMPIYHDEWYLVVAREWMRVYVHAKEQGVLQIRRVGDGIHMVYMDETSTDATNVLPRLGVDIAAILEGTS
jgi:hypothetical protein